jgi:hypothetical protein
MQRNPPQLRMLVRLIFTHLLCGLAGLASLPAAAATTFMVHTGPATTFNPQGAPIATVPALGPAGFALLSVLLAAAGLWLREQAGERVRTGARAAAREPRE